MISGAELAGAMLGMLFVTLGLAASGAAALRSVRRDRTLLWFGVFTFLYGLRLIARSDVVQAVLPVPAKAWHPVEDVITYVILVVAALLAGEALAGRRRFLRYVWIVDLVCAFVSIAWDIAVRRSGAAMPLNRALVVANIAAAVVSVALDARLRKWTSDGWIVLAGASVFAGIALVENVHGGFLEPVDTEPIAMLVLIGCLGYVVMNRVFRTERRVAAVSRELETARQIQQSILPKRPPDIDGLAIAAHYDSMAEVAGDFYDFIVTPSGQLGVLVADVSGHGVPAAIIASMVKIALAVQEGEIGDPGTVLMRMNRALCGRFELAYVTAVFALIDPRERSLTYASAGHPSPQLVRTDGRVESLDERGIVLGFLPDAGYTSATVRDLSPGDRAVFYTDGVTEASRDGGEFFGDRQFHEALTGGLPESPDRFLATLVGRARQWTGADFADDVTVVVVDMTRATDAANASSSRAER